ncbi:hypothetical protein D3C71_734440 [compost metagenome]
MRCRCKQVRSEKLRKVFTRDLAESLAGFNQDWAKVVSLPLVVFAHDANSVPITCNAIIAPVGHSPPRFFIECLRVVTEDVVLRTPTEYQRRRPHFTDQNPPLPTILGIVRVVRRIAKPEVISQTSTMVLVRVTQQEGVDEWAVFGIPLQPLPQCPAHVRSVIVRIVCGLADPRVNQNGGDQRIGQPNQRHITGTHLEKRHLGSHISLPGHWASLRNATDTVRYV